jgi:hypothetical protein
MHEIPSHVYTENRSAECEAPSSNVTQNTTFVSNTQTDGPNNRIIERNAKPSTAASPDSACLDEARDFNSSQGLLAELSPVPTMKQKLAALEERREWQDINKLKIHLCSKE